VRDLRIPSHLTDNHPSGRAPPLLGPSPFNSNCFRGRRRASHPATHALCAFLVIVTHTSHTNSQYFLWTHPAMAGNTLKDICVCGRWSGRREA
jgi:hypothetical protein